MTPENLAVFDEVVRSSAVELFEHYGLPALPAGEPETPQARKAEVAFAAVIGFAGEDARGNLTLAVGEQVLSQTAPEAKENDWIGELSNQFLGRVKNKLLRYGMVIEVTPPLVVSGKSVRLSGLRTSTVRLHTFNTDSGEIRAWFRVQLEEGVTMALTDNPDFQAPDEGELVMF